METTSKVYLVRVEINGFKCILMATLDRLKEKGITVIGGPNGAGKTTALDAIAWTLGGAKFRPSNPNNDNSEGYAETLVELSNGLIAERKGKNGTLQVTDSKKMRGTQAILSDLIGELALDLPQFLNAKPKQKAEMLLQSLGIGEQLTDIDIREKEASEERTAAGRDAKQKRGHADSLEYDKDAPEEAVSAAELLAKQAEIQRHNAINAKVEADLRTLNSETARAEYAAIDESDKLDDLRRQLNAQVEVYKEAMKTQEGIAVKRDAMVKKFDDLEEISTDDIEAQIENVDTANAAVRANDAKRDADTEADYAAVVYIAKGGEIDAIRTERAALLSDANLPLDGLSIEGGELIYNGQKWDCMATSEQLRVGVSIVHLIKPECGFVLIDQLESMDTKTLEEFGQWLESQDLQAIGTRVSTGDECTVIIEDGVIAENNENQKGAL